MSTTLSPPGGGGGPPDGGNRIMCSLCGIKPVSSFGRLCDTCSSTKRLQSRKPTKTAAATPVWKTQYFTNSNITSGGKAIFKHCIGDGIGPVMLCLQKNANATTDPGVGAQYSIYESAKSGTTTIDYQGTNQGTGSGVFFINIQGQSGKGNARKTYFQIQVQSSGTQPSQADVQAAILTSLNLAVRAVLRQSDCTSLPNGVNPSDEVKEEKKGGK